MPASADPRPRPPLAGGADAAPPASDVPRPPAPGGGEPTAGVPPSGVAEARPDGRRVHVVDRALDYVALAEGGLSAARIARKRRRSAGYVSILLRLGRAIATMEPAELAALRSPRVTWKLAQRVVRSDADVGSIRHQLRLALGGFSTHNVDRRRNRVDRRASAGIGIGGRGGGGSAWGWDEAWFTRDPADFVRHHTAHLATLHRAVVGRAARAAAQGALRRLSIGQSLAALQRSLASPPPSASARPADRALAALAAFERHLAAAEREIADILAAPAAAGSAVGPAADVEAPSAALRRQPSDVPPAPLPPSAFDVDDDLEP